MFYNPRKWDRYDLSKERLDVNFKHAIDLIRVKITPMRSLFFIQMQDSPEYRFADDGVS